MKIFYLCVLLLPIVATVSGSITVPKPPVEQLRSVIEPKENFAAPDADLIPDISVAEDALDLVSPKFAFIFPNVININEDSIGQELNNVIPQLIKIMEQAHNIFEAANKNVDLIPDISVAADAIDEAEPQSKAVDVKEDADLIPDISVAGDAIDEAEPQSKAVDVKEDADLIPDISVAADAIDEAVPQTKAVDVKEDAVLIPDISVASDADDLDNDLSKSAILKAINSKLFENN